MSDLQNDKIKEFIYESLEYLYEHDDEVCYRVSRDAEMSNEFFDKDYYSDMCWEHLETLTEIIFDGLGETSLHSKDDVKELVFAVTRH